MNIILQSGGRISFNLDSIFPDSTIEDTKLYDLLQMLYYVLISSYWLPTTEVQIIFIISK